MWPFFFFFPPLPPGTLNAGRHINLGGQKHFFDHHRSLELCSGELEAVSLFLGRLECYLPEERSWQ